MHLQAAGGHGAEGNGDEFLGLVVLNFAGGVVVGPVLFQVGAALWMVYGGGGVLNGLGDLFGLGPVADTVFAKNP
jgi:hypothetical protein